MARHDGRRVRHLPAHRPTGPCRRPGLADHGRIHGRSAHRAVRHPGGDGHRDPAAPAVRHRRHHQPRRGLRAALGRFHRRVRGHRARHRDIRGPPQRPGAHDRRGGHDRPAVPAAATPRPAVREPPGLRQAGHAVPGAGRLRRGHGRTAGPDRGRRPDGVRPGRRDRGRPGRGVDPGRNGTAPGRDLAARIAPVHRRHDPRRRRPACLRGSIARGRRYPRQRIARRADPAQATERVPGQHRGRAVAAPGVAGRPGPAQRRADRRAAGHHR